MATPEKQPGLSFFLSNFYVASLQTAWGSSPSRMFSAPETGSSPRKSGSLPNYFIVSLQTARRSSPNVLQHLKKATAAQAGLAAE